MVVRVDRARSVSRGGSLSRPDGQVVRFDVVTTTATTWGIPFFLSIGVAIGVKTGLDSVFDLAPAESRQLGVAWIAAAVVGLVVVLGMIAIGNRLVRELHSITPPESTPEPKGSD